MLTELSNLAVPTSNLLLHSNSCLFWAVERCWKLSITAVFKLGFAVESPEYLKKKKNSWAPLQIYYISISRGEAHGSAFSSLPCTLRCIQPCLSPRTNTGELSPGRCGLRPWSMLAVPPFGFLHMCSGSQTLNIFSFTPCAQLMQRCPDNPRAQVHVGRM